jgi:methylamine dehydrogenase light chain
MFTKLEKMLQMLDSRAEKQARKSADTHGRRGFLSKVGGLMVASALFPVLPFDRSMGKAYAADGSSVFDETSCDYWRYCALDGTLCNDSGGTNTSCPPGSDASKVAWVGTCLNPDDGKDYLVSYNDCCGKAALMGSTFCFTSQDERPGYRMGLHNDINWCMANDNKGYYCTVAMLVGLVDDE